MTFSKRETPFASGDRVLYTDVNRWEDGIEEAITKAEAASGGTAAVSPTIEVYKNTSTEYVLKITTADGTFYTPNLKGSDGTGTSIAEWAATTAYALSDLVSYSGKTYKCISAHTSGDAFTTDSAKWIEVVEVYYVVTQSQHDQMVAEGLITDETEYLYVIKDATN